MPDASIFAVRRPRFAAGLILLLAAGCSKPAERSDTATIPATSSGARSAASTPATDSGPGMQGMANMTGDADHDFLRMMADHHKGLIQLAHMTKDRKGVGTAAADAAKLDAAQGKEIDHMVTMLKKDYKDPYTPKVMPEHQAMADALEGKTGKEYERAFYQDIIKHHQEAIKMIDGYLPKAKNPMVKQMAEKMKADQTKEIADFQRKVDSL
jgi:uncharacterized protein (DUF305 family)